MSKVQASTDIDRVKDDEVKRFVNIALDDIVRVINGNLDFDNNFSAKTLSVTFSSANTEVAIQHGLGRVPSNYIQMQSSAATSLYNGSSANTSSTLYLKASAAATVSILVF